MYAPLRGNLCLEGRVRLLPKRAPHRLPQRGHEPKTRNAVHLPPQRNFRLAPRIEPRHGKPRSEYRNGKQITHAFSRRRDKGFSHKLLPRDNNREKPSTLLVANWPGLLLPAYKFRIETPQRITATNIDTESTVATEALPVTRLDTDTPPAQHTTTRLSEKSSDTSLRNDCRNGERNGPTGEYTLDRVQCVFGM